MSLIIAICSLLFEQKTPFLAITLFNYDFTVFVLCIVFGVLLDIDHILDYRLNEGNPFRSLKSQFEKGRMYVIFHGVEGAILLVILANIWPFLLFPAISYACHILMDIYYNGVSFQAYFYIVRLGRKRKISKMEQDV